MYLFGKRVGCASVKTLVQCIVLVAKIDENGVRSSPGTILGYPLHPRTLLVTTSAGFLHERGHILGGFWGLTFVTFRCFCSSCFFLAFLSCSFGDFAATRVTKVAKKGAKMEPKALAERLRDMCQKHAIYCTGSTSDLPGSAPKPDVSANPTREAPRTSLEVHFCDSLTVWGAPLGSVLRPWGRPFSLIFSDTFPGRPLTS